MPGLAALNVRGTAEVASVSCRSAGNCSAGGYYTDGSGRSQGFVVSQSNGVWGNAIQVPGLGALNNPGPSAQVNSVSCASAGNCSAGGFYNDGLGFVVSQSSGHWGKAIEVPGLAALNGGLDAPVNSVSCRSAGNCSAGGSYRDSSNHSHFQGFVVSQSKGVWGKAIEVPGLGALNAGPVVKIDSVSCASAGNCSAGGFYTDGSGFRQGFVASESSGHWGTAIEVPGLGALNAGGHAEVYSVSCASAGNCSAGGFYTDSPSTQGFVVSQSNGLWGPAIEVPGLAALNAGGSAQVGSVSCSSAGNCSAGGSYTASLIYSSGFVVSQS